ALLVPHPGEAGQLSHHAGDRRQGILLAAAVDGAPVEDLQALGEELPGVLRAVPGLATAELCLTEPTDLDPVGLVPVHHDQGIREAATPPPRCIGARPIAEG